MNPDIFSPEFRNTAFYEELPSLLKRSPQLRKCMEDFEELGYTISVGRAGHGSYCQGGNIVFDAATLDCTSDERLAVTLAHEIGHARSDLGKKLQGVTEITKFLDLYLRDEGIAVTTEHKTAVDLGLRKPGGIYEALEKVSEDEERIKIGAEIFRKLHPSGSPLLNYEETYSLGFASRASRISIPPGYMQGITPDKFSITHTPEGGFILEIPRGADVVVRDGKDNFKTQHYFRAEFDSKLKPVGPVLSESSPLTKEAAEQCFADQKAKSQKAYGFVPSTTDYNGPISTELKQHPFGEALSRLAEESPTLSKCLDDLDRRKGQIFLHTMPKDYRGSDVFFDPKEIQGLSGEEFALKVASQIDMVRRYLPPSEKALYARERSLDSQAYAACTEFRVSRELGVPMSDQDLQTRLERSEGHRTEAAKRYVRNSQSPLCPNLTKEELNHILAALDTAKVALPPETLKHLKPGQIKIKEYPDGGFDLTIPIELSGKIKEGSEWKEINGFKGSFAPNGVPREKPGLGERFQQMDKELFDTVESQAQRFQDWFLDKIHAFKGPVTEQVDSIDDGLSEYFDSNPNLGDIAETYKKQVVRADETRELAVQMNESPEKAQKVRNAAVFEAQENAKSEIRIRAESGHLAASLEKVTSAQSESTLKH